MRIPTLVLLALLSGTTLAQATMPDRALALEFLQVSRYEQVLDASLVEYKRQLVPNASPEMQANFEKLMQVSLGWEALKEPLVDLVVAIYTREELLASIAFMKSEAGASATAKSTEFSTRFSALVAENLKAALRRMQEEKKAAAPTK